VKGVMDGAENEDTDIEEVKKTVGPSVGHCTCVQEIGLYIGVGIEIIQIPMIGSLFYKMLIF
jgi:hypothetical protein